jgi:hypothetical protein
VEGRTYGATQIGPLTQDQTRAVLLCHVSGRLSGSESELSILSALDFDLQADVLNVSQELYKSSFTLISLKTTAAMSRENRYLV